MQKISSRLKNTPIVLATIILLLGLTAGLNLRPASEAEAAPGAGGVSYFLKIDGVSGDSADNKHKGEIEPSSYAWSKDNPGLLQSTSVGSGGGGGAGKVQLHDIYFTANVSKASPQLIQATASGKHFKEAVLSVRKAGKSQQDFMTIKLTDVLVSSYRSAGNDSNIPTDEFSLNFAKIEFSHASQKPDGTLDTPTVGTWDFEANKAQ